MHVLVVNRIRISTNFQDVLDTSHTARCRSSMETGLACLLQRQRKVSCTYQERSMAHSQQNHQYSLIPPPQHTSFSTLLGLVYQFPDKLYRSYTYILYITKLYICCWKQFPTQDVGWISRRRRQLISEIKLLAVPMTCKTSWYELSAVQQSYWVGDRATLEGVQYVNCFVLFCLAPVVIVGGGWGDLEVI